MKIAYLQTCRQALRKRVTQNVKLDSEDFSCRIECPLLPGTYAASSSGTKVPSSRQFVAWLKSVPLTSNYELAIASWRSLPRSPWSNSTFRTFAMHHRVLCRGRLSLAQLSEHISIPTSFQWPCLWQTRCKPFGVENQIGGNSASILHCLRWLQLMKLLPDRSHQLWSLE